MEGNLSGFLYVLTQFAFPGRRVSLNDAYEFDSWLRSQPAFKNLGEMDRHEALRTLARLSGLMGPSMTCFQDLLNRE